MLPDTAPEEEKSAQAIQRVARVREAFEAMEAFGKAHPLIKTMHWQITALTRNIYG